MAPLRAQWPKPGLLRSGLSQKLLTMTALFVLMAEVLIYIPSVTSFRNTWLDDRLASAATAALVLDATPHGVVVPQSLARDVLNSIKARALVVTLGEERRLLAATEPVPAPTSAFDRRDETPFMAVAETFDTLLSGSGRMMRVIGEAPHHGDTIEITIDEGLLQEALLDYSGNVLLVSLLISLITAFLVYLALTWLLVEPMERLTRNMVLFAQKPEDAGRILAPSGRTDEVGLAEHELARMQLALRDHLQQKSKLAALGLAVAKINHDLRNMLTGAQLLSDRLSESDDPTVQRLAPRLMGTIDRAISFCQDTLSYGKAVEPPPRPQRFPLHALVSECAEALALPDSDIDFINQVPLDFHVTADRVQLDRVLNNLLRNAMQALENASDKRIIVSARHDGDSAKITITDTGPGIPAATRAHLFEAFRSSARRGTGLGLAIAADLVRGHGGDIMLNDTRAGASFTLMLPDHVRSEFHEAS